MRHVALFLLLMVVMAGAWWAVFGFISLVWNPLLWDAFGRFMYIFFVVVVGGFISGALTVSFAVYEEEQEAARKRG